MLAGYFGKVFTRLAERRPVHLLKYLVQQNGTLDRLMQHSGQTSIGECLLKVFEMEEGSHSPEMQALIKERKAGVVLQLLENMN